MSRNASFSVRKYTCQICDKILHKPIFLPCTVCKRSSGNICKEHLNEIFMNNAREALFECKQCKTKLNLSKVELKENTHLNFKLKRFDYLSHTKLKLKLTLDAKLDEIEKYLGTIREMKEFEYREKIYDYFFALRNDVDIKRETVLEKIYKNQNENNNNNKRVEEITQINQISANLIEKIDFTENEFRKNVTHEIEYNIMGVISIEECKKRLNENLRDVSLIENDLKKLQYKYETKQKIIQSKPIRIDKKFNARLKENLFREYIGGEHEFNFKTLKFFIT